MFSYHTGNEKHTHTLKREQDLSFEYAPTPPLIILTSPQEGTPHNHGHLKKGHRACSEKLQGASDHLSLFKAMKGKK